MPPGSGTMTPITPGAPAGASRAQPIPYTLLSLPRFAKVMGINPLHFCRGATPGLHPMVLPVIPNCDDFWFKYDWQDVDKVSWYQLANVILAVEQELADIVGFWPAPKWIVEESHLYPRPFQPEYTGYGYNNRARVKSTELKYGKVLSAGRRATTLIANASTLGGSLVYSDDDGDGFFETATVRVATALTTPFEIKVYHAGFLANPDWEIRLPRSATISGGFVTFKFDSWLFIDPSLYEDFPTDDGMSAIDVSTVANFVASVDVYREYADFAQASVEFKWDTFCSSCGGSGCSMCSPSTQDGCFAIRDDRSGIVIPTPGEYDVASGQWIATDWTEASEPDSYKAWYYAGEKADRYLNGFQTDPLSEFWAQIIAWVTVARLERPLSGCVNIHAMAEKLRFDLALNQGDTRAFLTPDVITCPLGTHLGEVMAWKRIKHFVKDKVLGVALV